jgi:peroxiredoxin
MYKALLTSWLFFSCMHLYAQHQFVLSGHVPEDSVDLELTSANSAFRSLETVVKKRAFEFRGHISDDFEQVHLNASKNGVHIRGWTFYIKAGEMKIEVLTFDKRSAEDSAIRYFNVPFLEEQKRYASLMKPVLDSVYLLNTLIKRMDNGFKVEHQRDTLLAMVAALKEKELNQKVEFVKNHPDAFFSLDIFYKDIVNSFMIDFKMDPDSLMALYAHFNESLKTTALGKGVDEFIARKKSVLLNNVLPDFAFTTDAGEKLQLSSFRQKEYVLICFWDSYCKPCIKSIPLLKKLDAAYAGKGLQMISVSLDRDPKRWFNALEKYKLPWLQTCDLPAYIPGTAVRSLYEINYIPQYFLIDKEGKVIYHNTQLRDGDEYTILQNILKQRMN